MPRWEPNARERLADAALALFAERGVDRTTVDDIAAAAGLTRSTFFRHFRDKTETLFPDHDALVAAIDERLASAAPEAVPVHAVELALAGLADEWFSADHRAAMRARTAVIASCPDLRDRATLKGLAVVAALAHGLTERGVDPLTAQVVALLATTGLDRAVDRWVAGDEDFAPLVRAAVTETVRTASGLVH